MGVTFDDVAQGAGKDSIAAVRSDGDATNWTIFGYADKEVITHQACGSGGISELKEKLDVSQVQFALLRTNDERDGKIAVKFVLIYWLGGECRFMVKARAGTHRGAVEEFLGQSHVQWDAESLDEVSAELLATKIGDASGTSNRVLDDNMQRVASAARTGKSAGRVGGGNFGYEDQEGQEAALRAVRDDDNDTDWAVVGYTPGTKTIVLLGSGSGGIEELAQVLPADSVAFGFVRLTIQVDHVSTSTKFTRIEWVGKALSTIRKAQLLVNAGNVTSWMDSVQAAHLTWSSSDAAELTAEALRRRVRVVAGVADHTVERAAGDDEAGSSGPAPAATPADGGPAAQQQKKPYRIGAGGASLINNPNAGRRIAATASRSLPVTNEAEWQAGIGAVRSDDDASDWVLLGFVAGFKELEYVGHGTGGATALCAAITDPTGGAYAGIIRVPCVVDGHNVIKFCAVFYQGSGIRVVQKAKLTTMKGALNEVLGQYHCDMSVSAVDELSADAVKEVVDAVAFEGRRPE